MPCSSGSLPERRSDDLFLSALQRLTIMCPYDHCDAFADDAMGLRLALLTRFGALLHCLLRWVPGAAL